MDAEEQAQDVPWQLYSADLKVSQMLIKHPLPSLKFDIPIRPPLRFDPAGRPPPRVGLQPRKDTDAYIVDKVVLPLEPFTEPGDPRQRRVYYIVAWPDLRAARPVVDAVKILDYVSPRELEDWEYRDALRRVKEKEDAEAEAATAKKLVLNAAGVLVEKKKPGRKPKNAMRAQIRPPTPELDSEEEEILARKKQGPSLSTPQKSRILQLESELDMLDSEEASAAGDPDADIHMQLENEAAGQEFEDEYDGEGDEQMMLLPSNNAVSMSGGSSPPSRARSSSLNPSSLQKKSATGKVSPAPPVSQLKPKPKHAQVMPATTNPKPTSSTPIPLPFHRSLLSQKKASPTIDTPKPSSRDSPTTKAQKQPTLQKSMPRLVTETPRSGMTLSHSPTPESSGGFVPANSFTPVGGHFPRPPKRPAEDSLESVESPRVATPTTAPFKKDRKKKQRKESQPPAAPAEGESLKDVIAMTEPEPEFVVKRLEGDRIVDGVHYFKVRWEGEWPPDQNPTWEPEDHIASVLVKKYLKRKAEKEAAKPKSNKTPKNKSTSGEKQQQTLAQWARKYASVSEAFEGKAEWDHNSSGLGNSTENGDVEEAETSGRHNDDNDDPDAMDELLVVDDSQPQETPAEKSRRLSAQVAAQFASLTPGRRTQL